MRSRKKSEGAASMLAGAVTSILGATEGGRCAARIADAVWRAVEFMRIIQEKSGREAGLFASCSSHGVSKFGRCLTMARNDRGRVFCRHCFWNESRRGGRAVLPLGRRIDPGVQRRPVPVC